MKVLVVGCGSIGRRHAINAAKLAQTAVVDIRAEAAADCAREAGAFAFTNIEAAFAWKPDGVVVATPHRSHLAIAREAVAAGAHVLIEKPLSHTLEGVGDLLAGASRAGRRVYVVCNMRFHPGPATLKAELHRVGKPWFARAHVGNYLPAMRPGRDYRELYAARRSEGGGVILDAVHEIDYLTWLFGFATGASCRARRLSDLDLDVEDHALIALRHDGGVESSAELDYLRMRKSRGCEIVGSEGVLLWHSDGRDPERCTVRYFAAGATEWVPLAELSAVDTAEPYRALMRAFIREIEAPGSTPIATAREGAAVLATALCALESSAAGGAEVRLAEACRA